MLRFCRRTVWMAALFGAMACAADRCAAQDEAAEFWLLSDDPPFPALKGIELGNDWKVTGGGELRYRGMDEANRLRPLGETQRDTYGLYRVTPFVEATHDLVTLYVQGIDAESFGEELPVLPIDVNRSDLLQFYFDVNLWEPENGGILRLRGGRQFLKYGSEHLISPLPWSNTYRTFEGLRLYYADEAWSIDAFAVQPVNGAASARQFHPYSRDEADSSQWFGGVYATYKQLPHSTLDVYWLWLRETDRQLNRLDGNRQTTGARLAGATPLPGSLAEQLTLSWDLEGAYQFGNDDLTNGGQGLNIRSGFLSAISGITFTKLPWTPTLQGVVWWGSGDGNPADGHTGTVSTLFPLGHAYWGILDNFNGSNLRDYSLQCTVKPHKKGTVVLAWHYFEKDHAEDFIYNIAGVPFGNLTTPERYLGQEVDLIGTLQLNKNLQLQTGYSWFWYGPAVSDNAGIAQRGDAHQFYVMTTWSF